jgi:hypothetical protein
VLLHFVNTETIALCFQKNGKVSFATIKLKIYGMSHESGAIRDLGYLTKKEKCKERKVVANHVFPVSSVGIFYPGRFLAALHSLHYQ